MSKYIFKATEKDTEKAMEVIKDHKEFFYTLEFLYFSNLNKISTNPSNYRSSIEISDNIYSVLEKWGEKIAGYLLFEASEIFPIDKIKAMKLIYEAKKISPETSLESEVTVPLKIYQKQKKRALLEFLFVIPKKEREKTETLRKLMDYIPAETMIEDQRIMDTMPLPLDSPKVI